MSLKMAHFENSLNHFEEVIGLTYNQSRPQIYGQLFPLSRSEKLEATLGPLDAVLNAYSVLKVESWVTWMKN